MMSYMRALSSFNEGDKIKVIVERSGTTITADIEF
jgi:ribosomal protein L21E